MQRPGSRALGDAAKETPGFKQSNLHGVFAIDPRGHWARVYSTNPRRALVEFDGIDSDSIRARTTSRHQTRAPARCVGHALESLGRFAGRTGLDQSNGFEARALELKHLSGLEAFLIDVLDPVLSPAPSAKWSGPFQQTILDARLIDEEFLPGEMRLAAPWVLCIQDRRRPVRLGVLLQKNGKSEFIGPLPEMEPFHDATKLPHVEPQKNAIRIGEHIVKLPRLNVPLHVEIARAGFVIVSAVDSQRLWVVESV